MFTVGFVAMSRHIVNSGAFYSYISHGLGRVVGVGAAFVALPAYALMQIGLFGLFGVVGVRHAGGARRARVGWFACALVGLGAGRRARPALGGPQRQGAGRPAGRRDQPSC